MALTLCLGDVLGQAGGYYLIGEGLGQCVPTSEDTNNMGEFV